MSDELSQDVILRRLAALLLQIGNLPPGDDICADAYRQGIITGVCTAAAVAGGGGADAPMSLNSLASAGLNLLEATDWSTNP